MSTPHAHRRIAIVPAAQQNAANVDLEALGWGPETFSRAMVGKLSLATAPPTHYCCDVACTLAMLAELEAVVAGDGGTVRDEGPLGTADRLATATTAENLKPK